MKKNIAIGIMLVFSIASMAQDGGVNTHPHVRFSNGVIVHSEYNRQIKELNVVVSEIEALDGNEITETYVHEVYKLIEKSKLSEVDKNTLKIGVSVGFASSCLWNPEGFAE